MEPLAVVGVNMSVLATLTGASCLDENIRILKGKTKYLRAKIDDIETEYSQLGKKRKRDDHLCAWMTAGQELLEGAESLLSEVEEGFPHKKRLVQGDSSRSFLSFTKMVAAQRLIDTLAAHERKVDVLLRCKLSVEGLGHPSRGNLIPVKDLIGYVASTALEKLQNLLHDHKYGRIAICGMEGVGKTTLMKHLHNYAVKCVERFDYVCWVTFPDHFSIRSVQDAVAAAVKCDLSNTYDLNARARKLSETLVGLGRFVIFLDNVPEAIFSVEQVGIPVNSAGTSCKLVVTTCSISVSKMLDCSGIVKIDPLPEEEAFELFMHEARVGVESLNDISRLLAKECNGMPHKIADIATSMCHINDICEWRNMLFEVGYLRKGNDFRFQVVTDGSGA